MPICVEEDVFGLDIPVNNIMGVNVLDGNKLSDGIREGRVIGLMVDVQVPPCKIEQLPRQMASFFEGLGDHLREDTPISMMSGNEKEGR
jgi:hypothetical protein